jgi:hypothetical protein
MKRKYKPRKTYSFSYKTIKPWFEWYRCHSCGMEFRREVLHIFNISYRYRATGYGTFLRVSCGYGTDIICLCTECVPDYEGALKYWNDKLLMMYKHD